MSVNGGRWFVVYLAYFSALFLGVVLASALIGSAYYAVFRGLSVFMSYPDWLRIGIVPVCASALGCAAFFAPFCASAWIDRQRKEGGRK